MLTRQQRAELSARLRRSRDGGDGGDADRIARRDPGLAAVPASSGQEQLWFIDRFAPGQAVYNIPCVLRIGGSLDPACLGRALDGLIARHEALRTRLVPDGQGRPRQVIDPPAPVRLETADLTESALGRYARAEGMRPFDLAGGPLLRATLVRLAGTGHALVTVFHHAVFDGLSARILVQDLAGLYRAEVTGEPSGLARLPVQFADYAVWERDRISGGALTGCADYWRRTLSGFETVRFPADLPRPAVDDFTGARAEHAMDGALLDGLRGLSAATGSTVFGVLLASLFALLSRYAGQDDLMVGTVSANRGRPELAGLIGFLVNTLPIRVDASGDPPFTELLARVRGALIGAFAHQDLPFGEIVGALSVARDASRAPLFQIALTYAEPDLDPVPAGGAEFSVSDEVRGVDAAKFDLAFVAEARPDCLWIECCYKTALFRGTTVTSLLRHWDVLLHGVIESPRARLSELPLLTPAELDTELRHWNDTAGPVPAGCAHQIFEAQVARTPSAIAASCGEERLSYADLNREANRFAWHLRGLGVGPEDLVGVRMEVSVRRLAALLGVWKAGAGYVPLDPALPAGRLGRLVEDAGIRVVLTDDRPLGPGGRDDDPAGTGVNTASVAYVIYTSGSTGQPKGVVVEHRNLVNLAHAAASRWQVGPGSRVLAWASFAFDASVLDMFTALLNGATVVLPPPQAASSPSRLAALLREERITFTFLPPAVLGLLPDGGYPDLRVLFTGAEQVPPELARRWIRPGLRLVNAYGPTEATVAATWAELDAATPMPPPIGYPIRPNVTVYLLDRHGGPVPPGVPGELHIGGAGVARGYLNRPELTAERFVRTPYGRLYKTGDLARRRPDGSLAYLGRMDRQVKIRGLRVEPGEIEAALAACPGVDQAVVTVVDRPGGDRELAGYVRPAAACAEAGLRARLARTLPAALIPAYLTGVDSFPLNSSGKVDRARLPVPERASAAGDQRPRTPTEALVAGVYAEVLGIARAGATDSFFDLGGNSLSAMRLVDAIGERTGTYVAVTTVFLHPAPRQLAAVVDAGHGTRPGPGPLVALTPGGAGRAPLLLIHAVGGTVTGYAAVSRELADDFAVTGLESPVLSGAGEPAATLDELITDYTRRVRAAWPHGPYLLGGWSMGGVLAFEVARRLEAAAERVGLLVLLDAPFAIAADAGDGDLAARFAADVAHGLGLPESDVDIGSPRLARRFRVFAAHSKIMAGYRPQGRPVRASALIVSADGSPNAPARFQWPGLLAGSVSVHPVPGDHYAFLRPPLTAGVARAIREHGPC